jgi:DNA-binding protein YbaB
MKIEVKINDEEIEMIEFERVAPGNMVSVLVKGHASSFHANLSKAELDDFFTALKILKEAQ